MNIGVYKILNTINNKFYIGSSIVLNKRFQQHKSELRANKHHCIKLQRGWNKYGEENFEFEILARCPAEYVIKLEQYFIDILNPFYNICPVAGSAKGRILTDVHKEKLRLANLGKSHSEERIKNITEARRKANTSEFIEKQRKNATGKKQSEETKKKHSLAIKEHLKNPEVYKKRIEQLKIARKQRFKTNKNG